MKKISTFKKIRREFNMTQAEFGQALNLSRLSISNYETFKRVIPPYVALRVIEYAKSRGIYSSLDEIYSETKARRIPANQAKAGA